MQYLEYRPTPDAEERVTRTDLIRVIHNDPDRLLSLQVSWCHRPQQLLRGGGGAEICQFLGGRSPVLADMFGDSSLGWGSVHPAVSAPAPVTPPPCLVVCLTAVPSPPAGCLGGGHRLCRWPRVQPRGGGRGAEGSPAAGQRKATATTALSPHAQCSSNRGGGGVRRVSGPLK